jgi:hypothetical protein
MFCKKVIVAKSREVKTGWPNNRQIWQDLLSKAMTQKGLFAKDDDLYIYLHT